MQRVSPHSTSGGGGAPWGLSKPPLRALTIWGTFHCNSACNTKKGDRSLPTIKWLCVECMKYKHLTAEQRYIIDVLLREKWSSENSGIDSTLAKQYWFRDTHGIVIIIDVNFWGGVGVIYMCEVLSVRRAKCVVLGRWWCVVTEMWWLISWHSFKLFFLLCV